MVEIEERAPTVEEYGRLREAMGWYPVAGDAVLQGLENALFSICAVADGQVIGCARIVGDGGMYFYVQDMMVLPPHRGCGIGRTMMEHLMAYLGVHARPGSFVGLMAAKGASGFYDRYGFTSRANDAPGMFRVWASRESTSDS